MLVHTSVCLTSSYSEYRQMQPCHSTGLSRRAEQLQRIAARVEEEMKANI